MTCSPFLGSFGRFLMKIFFPPPKPKHSTDHGHDKDEIIFDNDWVVVELSDFLHRVSTNGSLYSIHENYLFTPELKHVSNILTADICSALLPFLPARAQVSPWHLVYSTAHDGYSLRNLYQKTLEIESPSLLVVKDVENHVFGAVTSCMPRMRPDFRGNGESCVFSFSPDLKVWTWNEGNNYNILTGDPDWMAIGCGSSGGFALWLDSDLYHGRTESCDTYHNKRLCDCGDFVVKIIEIWTFAV